MKENVQLFAINDRVENTQQVSYYFGKRGVVVEVGRNRVRVRYDDGSGDTFVGTKVWLRKVS